MTDARHTIQQAGLPHVPTGVPITIVGSREGYAVAVGTAERVRWLHTTAGMFKTFSTIDRAAATLRASGITRFTVDVTGGTPQ